MTLPSLDAPGPPCNPAIDLPELQKVEVRSKHYVLSRQPYSMNGFSLLSQSLAAAICHTMSKDYSMAHLFGFTDAIRIPVSVLLVRKRHFRALHLLYLLL